VHNVVLTTNIKKQHICQLWSIADCNSKITQGMHTVVEHAIQSASNGLYSNFCKVQLSVPVGDYTNKTANDNIFSINKMLELGSKIPDHKTACIALRNFSSP